MIRVLVVDDSAFARKVLQSVLGRAPDIEIVGVARDGLEALERVAELQPDVITLDLVMPHLDGLGVLAALPAERAPRVVVVSISDADSDLGVAALQAGAFDLVHKPTALATDRLYEIEHELLDKVRAAAVAPRRLPGDRLLPAAGMTRAPVHRALVIGTSTGGPQALTRLLPAFPPGFPLPIATVLHIPAGYTEALARRLNEQTTLEVLEAEDGMEMRPGRMILARGGIHLKLVPDGTAVRARLDVEPAESLHRPAVDVLFASAAAAYGRVLAAVLTGMGSDGLAGARAIRAAGGAVLAEAASSCIVYGMPRSVVEAGLATSEAPLEKI